MVSFSVEDGGLFNFLPFSLNSFLKVNVIDQMMTDICICASKSSNAIMFTAKS
uniref:Uncharacterized protein n=1 Tax=Rhizophora mucronata TaxID=61149 RepID=A0A2P2N4H0_RHIMU